MLVFRYRLWVVGVVLAAGLTAPAMAQNHTARDDLFSSPTTEFTPDPIGDANRGIFGTPLKNGLSHNPPNASQPDRSKPASPPPLPDSPTTSAASPTKSATDDASGSDLTNALVLGLSFGIVGLVLAILSTVLMYRRHKRLIKEKKRAEDLEDAKETDEDFASGDDEEAKGVRFASKYGQQAKKIEKSNELEPTTLCYDCATPRYEDPAFAVDHIEYLRKCLNSNGSGSGTDCHTDLMDPSLSAPSQQPAMTRTSVDSITSYRLPSYSEPGGADLSMPSPRAAAGPTFYQDIFGVGAGSETAPIPFASGHGYGDAYETQLATVLEESFSSRSIATRTPSPLRSKTPPRPMTPVPEYAVPSSRTPSPVLASSSAGVGMARSVSPAHSIETHAVSLSSNIVPHSPPYLPDSPLSQQCFDYDQRASGSGSGSAERPRPGPSAARPSPSQGPPRPRRKLVKRGKLGPKATAKNAASRKVSTESIALYEAMDMI